ncbi:16S rRNA (uracil(1498)-N(3))-methyltransferase [Marinimicrobium sp. ABcell2]|uniref:16S rRNA (uracil(1498)-N(3))-methyltransferase n=1 Tax=Marinimicrobium sp. ABcell2 TaxID=3069751 RepID=UPI0027B1C03D|nr:16S rRNA (uracil(1498)-N(3))-methyltransferase [Marinimicrobium sp. ABcell2]MDQ2075458.1 16S rRNA (uracil(1498)-N(3))-methyltransferase [Marinimicrobium sp. ABcell2]
MNLVLLYDEDLVNASQAVIKDSRRLTHITQVHRAQVGDRLKVGRLNQAIGYGIVTHLAPDVIHLDVTLESPPPPLLPLTLILALPRPKMLRRILQTVATCGVRELVLINSYRVEKSYWQSPWLADDEIHRQLILGLEQGGATQLPNVILRKRFKPFVEDELGTMIQGREALIAHPYTPHPCPKQTTGDVVLAVGPEGGFIQYEVEKLLASGFQPIHLGERILRVETVIPFLLGRLF